MKTRRKLLNGMMLLGFLFIIYNNFQGHFTVFGWIGIVFLFPPVVYAVLVESGVVEEIVKKRGEGEGNPKSE